jgi:hypothetical protein
MGMFQLLGGPKSSAADSWLRALGPSAVAPPSISFDLPPVPVDRENAEQPKLARHRDVSATSSGVWFGGGFIV